MCSECPRSFCNVCLLRILTADEVEELDTLIDWVCMSCRSGLSSDPPSLDSRQWCIAKPTTSRKPKSSIYNSKATNAKLKAFLKGGPGSLNTQHLSAAVKSSPKAKVERIMELVKETTVTSKPALKNVSQKSAESPVFVPMVGLPYLDDFDDSGSDEEKIIVTVDDDDDCNLLISLPSRYAPPKKKKIKVKLPIKKQIYVKADSKVVMSPATPYIVKIPQSLQLDVKRDRKYSTKKLEAFSSIADVCSKASKKGMKGKKGVNWSTTGGPSSVPEASGTFLPPVNTVVDEVYYFSQYVQVS